MTHNYPNQRRKNCETGVLENMLLWHGCDVGEDLLFGIGSGLYFMYSPFLSVQGTVYPLMRIQPVEIVKRAAQRLGFVVHVKSFGDDRTRATASLDELLSKGIPVGVVLNVKGLPYFNAMGVTSDFNGHIVTIVGEDGNDYLVADTDSRLKDDTLVRVNKSTIEETRFAPGIGTPHGKIFWIDGNDTIAVSGEMLEKAIFSGLKETCNKFLHTPLPYYGAKGLHYFADDIRSWWNKYPQRQISYVIMWYYRLIERAGTGGAGYRYLYLGFLKEAARLLGNEALDDAAKTMASAAEGWRSFCLEGRRFIRQPEGATLQKMADVIDNIGDDEHKTFKGIQKGFIAGAKRHL